MVTRTAMLKASRTATKRPKAMRWAMPTATGAPPVRAAPPGRAKGREADSRGRGGRPRRVGVDGRPKEEQHRQSDRGHRPRPDQHHQSSRDAGRGEERLHLRRPEGFDDRRLALLELRRAEEG